MPASAATLPETAVPETILHAHAPGAPSAKDVEERIVRAETQGMGQRGRCSAGRKGWGAQVGQREPGQRADVRGEAAVLVQ